MDCVIDFEQLRELTEDDQELEAELFRLFLSDSAECVSSLKEALVTRDERAWKNGAHSLKGIAINLGAITLKNHCENAQNAVKESDDEKKILLGKIESCLLEVERMLRKKMLER